MAEGDNGTVNGKAKKYKKNYKSGRQSQSRRNKTKKNAPPSLWKDRRMMTKRESETTKRLQEFKNVGTTVTNQRDKKKKK